MKGAQEALRTLITNASLGNDLVPRVKLFSAYEPEGSVARHQHATLARLEAAGVLTSVLRSGGEPGTQRLWGFASADGLARGKELIKDNTKLSAALWPNAQPQLPPSGLEEEGEEGELEPESAPAAPADSSAVLDALAAVLRALQTIGASIAALHEKVGTIEAANLALHKRFDAQTLAAAPRLGELEAKQLKEGDILNYHNTHGVNPVRVVSVRSAAGQPICVNVSPVDKPDKVIPLTPKFLSHRSVNT